MITINEKTSRYVRFRYLIYTWKLSFSICVRITGMPEDGRQKYVRYFDISKLRYFDISKLSIRYPTLIHISWKIYNGWDPNIQWLGCSLSMQWLKLEWLRSSPSIGCLRFTQFSVGLENIPVTIIMKPTNSSTQGQPNPRKIRLKVACGPLFPTANIISWVGIGLDREQTYKKINPTKFSANTIVINNG